MNVIPTLFASSEFDDVLAQWQGLSAATKERLILLTAIALITVPVLVWAVFFRKTRRREHGHHHSHHHSYDSAEPAAEDAEGDSKALHRRRKWRRPRRQHRLRNPTLAETGGLPPVRTGEPPDIRP